MLDSQKTRPACPHLLCLKQALINVNAVQPLVVPGVLQGNAHVQQADQRRVQLQAASKAVGGNQRGCINALSWVLCGRQSLQRLEQEDTQQAACCASTYCWAGSKVCRQGQHKTTSLTMMARKSA